MRVIVEAPAVLQSTSKVANPPALVRAVALVKTPYYYKPAYRAEHFLTHYRAVADASPIPILLYSVPVFTNITLESPEIIALAQHPNIMGIKDSSGSIQRIGEVVVGAR